MPALRAVQPSEGRSKPRSTAPKTVTQAAATGTERELLVAMRTRIATAVEDIETPARDLAALTKRLFEVVREIKALDAREAEERATKSGPVADEAFDPSAI